MRDEDRIRINPMRDLGIVLDRRIGNAQHRVRSAIGTANVAVNGRRLTMGEIAMIQSMFGAHTGYARARIFPRNFWWPFPNDRAMAPDGNIFFPGDRFEHDFSLPSVPLTKRALFMHEATHLYQWYALRQWVWLRGPFDRNYRYDLLPGQALKDYGLEQMGQIVRDYYLLSNGGMADRRYRAEDYRAAVPVRHR